MTVKYSSLQASVLLINLLKVYILVSLARYYMHVFRRKKNHTKRYVESVRIKYFRINQERVYVTSECT